MGLLSSAERELVALGAAMGSNCVPCIEYHIPEARKAGLCDGKIGEAIQLADKVRQVPARKVLRAALGMLQGAQAGAPADRSGPDGAQPAQDRAQAVSDSAPAAPDRGTEQPCCA